MSGPLWDLQDQDQPEGIGPLLTIVSIKYRFAEVRDDDVDWE